LPSVIGLYGTNFLFLVKLLTSFPTNKIMFIETRSLSNAFREFTVYVRINIITKLFRLVEKKSNSLISNCTAAMIH